MEAGGNGAVLAAVVMMTAGLARGGVDTNKSVWAQREAYLALTPPEKAQLWESYVDPALATAQEMAGCGRQMRRVVFTAVMANPKLSVANLSPKPAVTLFRQAPPFARMQAFIAGERCELSYIGELKETIKRMAVMRARKTLFDSGKPLAPVKGVNPVAQLVAPVLKELDKPFFGDIVAALRGVGYTESELTLNGLYPLSVAPSAEEVQKRLPRIIDACVLHGDNGSYGQLLLWIGVAEYNKFVRAINGGLGK